MKIILFYLAIIIVLEYLVLLLFFRREWLPCIQFSSLMNAITLSASLFLLNNLGLPWWMILGITVLIEACGIYFFWIVRPAKAAVVSLVANGVSTGFFALATWLNINLFPF